MGILENHFVGSGERDYANAAVCEETPSEVGLKRAEQWLATGAKEGDTTSVAARMIGAQSL